MRCVVVRLSPAQRATLAEALSDAAYYREPEGGCADRDKQPGDGECFDHLSDSAQVAAYLELGAALGIEVAL